ncbi:outer membrane lipoprotein-sorting protein [uncultured Dokdonia sp.]|uniref:outer membrane lipoprotein-sorting protein n=1 Tax=uncultured Dokdonia sp. TaxID=575653 RepID=UPI00261B9476|nr:outer membrane lipoprotein-sorting protein [uncultured Dokdonia sp.]
MKTIKLLVAVVLMAVAIPATQAQTADEIIANYLENTGGEDAWKAVKGIKMTGFIKVQGLEIPITQIQMTDGRNYGVADFQGQKFYFDVFDGETLWSTNQTSMKAEKSDTESAENRKLDSNDFPDQFLNYKKKGYTLELLGKETIEGTETFKIKLTKEPIKVDGQEAPNVVFVYFDTENFVPIVEEREIPSGPAKGQIASTKYSDYTEYNGLYFATSIVSGLKGQPGGQEIAIKNIDFDPEVTDDMFAFPTQE